MNEIIKALVKTQMEIKPPVKDKINRFKTKYASIDAIYDACRIPLATNGLSLSHSVETTEGKHYLKTTLFHVSGEQINNVIPLFIDQLTSQGLGAALTYAKKNAVCCILGLPTEEDDDGNKASDEQSPTKSNQPKTFLNDQQIDEIEQFIEDDVGLLNRILVGYGKGAVLDSLKEIPSENFNAIISALKKRKIK